MDTTTVEMPPEWATFTAEQRAFLVALPIHRTLSAAADAIGISRETVWRWNTPGKYGYAGAEFSDALLLAKEQTGDEVEQEMLRRALEGKSAMSDTLLIFATKRFRPEYRESYQVNVNQRIEVQHSIAELDSTDRRALLQLLLDDPTIIDAESVDVPTLPAAGASESGDVALDE